MPTIATTAHLLGTTVTNVSDPAQRSTIVAVTYDAARGRFVLLVTEHQTGQLAQRDAAELRVPGVGKGNVFEEFGVLGG